MEIAKLAFLVPIIIKPLHYLAELIIKLVSVNRIPWEFYIDKEIKIYTSLYKETEDKQCKEWYVDQIINIQKQKTALSAINKTISQGVSDILGALSILLVFAVVCSALKNDLNIYVYWTIWVIVFLNYIGAIFKFLYVRSKRLEVYLFYLNIAHSEYRELVSKDPYKIFAIYKESAGISKVLFSMLKKIS